MRWMVVAEGEEGGVVSEVCHVGELLCNRR